MTSQFFRKVRTCFHSMKYMKRRYYGSKRDLQCERAFKNSLNTERHSSGVNRSADLLNDAFVLWVFVDI
jgi:hypothetical protein